MAVVQGGAVSSLIQRGRVYDEDQQGELALEVKQNKVWATLKPDSVEAIKNNSSLEYAIILGTKLHSRSEPQIPAVPEPRYLRDIAPPRVVEVQSLPPSPLRPIIYSEPRTNHSKPSLKFTDEEARKLELLWYVIGLVILSAVILTLGGIIVAMCVQKRRAAHASARR